MDTHDFLSQRLVHLIECHADDLTTDILGDIRRHEATRSYHTYDEKKLYNRAFKVYSHLGKWLSSETPKEEIADHYMDIGRQRRQEGFALSEVIRALTIARHHIWLKVLNEGLLDTILEMNQAMDFNNRVVHFFDQAIYYAALGFEEKD